MPSSSKSAGKPKITIASSPNYERLIAEIEFPAKKLGIVISQEVESEPYEVSLFSLIDDSAGKFSYLKKCPEVSLSFDELIEALRTGRERLKAMDDLT